MEKITYKLEGFEGPLDLLLTLLSKNKVSIYDVSISELLEQYLAHIRAMQELDMEVASEFLDMAARLFILKRFPCCQSMRKKKSFGHSWRAS